MIGWEFLVTSLLMVASPGTGVLITLAAGLGHGARASLIAAFGCTFGIVPHLVAAVTGLAALLNASAIAFTAVKVVGVAYLVYMAIMALREDGPLSVRPAGERVPASRMVRDAILANLGNPKLSIFFLAFLPQFVPADDPAPLGTMTLLGLVFMGLTFGIFALYGLFAAAVRQHVLARPGVLRGLRIGFALGFLGLGAKLAVTRA